MINYQNIQKFNLKLLLDYEEVLVVKKQSETFILFPMLLIIG